LFGWPDRFIWPLAISDHGNNRTIAAIRLSPQHSVLNTHPVLFLLQFSPPLFRRTPWGMARRFSAVGQQIHKATAEPDIASALPPSPPASAHSIRSSVTLYEYGEYISTERISATSLKEEPMETQVEESPMQVEQLPVPKPRRPKGHYRLTDFIIQRTLGTGSFGRVHLGMWLRYLLTPFHALMRRGLVRSKHNLRFYAIKVLNKERVVKMKQVEHTNNEMAVLEQIQHAFIINLWGTFQDSTNLYMVMDFVPGGELFTLLRRSNVGTNVLTVFEKFPEKSELTLIVLIF
jgi:hypothetical protein